MTSPSKVLVVSRDRRASDGMRLGFEREGMTVESAESVATATFDDVAVVVAGADPDGDAAPFIRELVEKGAGVAPPLLYVGNGISRGAALAAGATAVLAAPAYVRDVVTIGRILAGRRPGNRSVMDGDLGQSFGVFYLVRALSRTGATGTLLMLRGLRRGEIRFFEGEVTSAQVGGLHGQAALDQLLLWTEARFELRDEPVVRRQQIPLTLDELLGHAERFLCDLREAAGSLSPSAVYEQDSAMLAQMGRQLPTEVHGVLRLFDGHRSVADVLEDSPFRVLETLRVAERAAQVGLLKKLVVAKTRNTHRAMLAVEEWLVGGASGEVAKPVTPEGSGPVGGGKKKGKGKNSGQMEVAKPKAVVEVDWAALVPRGAGLDAGALSPVVPSSGARGEITARKVVVPSRDTEREGLETLTDKGERDKLFAPLVEIAERDKLDAEEAEYLEAEKKAKDAAAEAVVKAKADAEAKVRREKEEAEEKARKEKEEKEAAAKAKADAEAKAKADAENAKREKDEAEKKAKADADAKAKADAEAKAKREKDEAEAKAKADADAKAKREKDEADAKAKADADAKAKREKDEADAKAKADADAKAKADAEAKAKADADAKAKAEADAKAAVARQKADAEEKAEAKEWEKAVEDAKAASAEAEKEKSDRATGKASGEIGGKASGEIGGKASGEIGGKASGELGAKASGELGAKASGESGNKVSGEGGGKASGEIAEKATGENQGDRSGELRPARATSNPDFVAGPKILVEELVETRSEARSIAEAATAAAEAAALAAKAAAATATAAATTAKSDGATAKSDGASATPAAIAAKADPAAPAQRATPTASGRAKRKSTQPPVGRSAASKEADRAVLDAQAAAQVAHSHFSDDEEAFFQAGQSAHEQPGSSSPADSFDDLDVGYQRVGFWDRLIGKKPTKPPPAKPPAAKAAAKKPTAKKPGQKK